MEHLSHNLLTKFPLYCSHNFYHYTKKLMTYNDSFMEKDRYDPSENPEHKIIIVNGQKIIIY